MLDQSYRAFARPSQAIRIGARLGVVYVNPALHNIHYYQYYQLTGRARRTLFNFGQAADSPYYSVAIDDSSFRIDDIPRGEYSVTARHPSLGVQKQTVTLGSGVAAEITFDFTGS